MPWSVIITRYMGTKIENTNATFVHIKAIGHPTFASTKEPSTPASPNPEDANGPPGEIYFKQNMDNN